MGDSEQQFNLRWNNYSSNMLQVLMEQFRCESLVDCTLSSQGQFLKAHKMVLSACSPYFQELFKNHESADAVVIFNGINFLDLKLVVEFMYQGEIKVLEAELEGLLAAAEALQVKGLSNVRGEAVPALVPAPAPAPAPASPVALRRKRLHSTSPSKSSCAKLEEAQEADATCTPASSVQDDSAISLAIKTEPPDVVAVERLGLEDDDEEDIAGWEAPNMVSDVQCDGPCKKKVRSNNKISKTLRSRVGDEAEAYRTRGKVRRGKRAASTRGKGKDREPEEKPSMGEWLDHNGSKIPRPPNAFMIFANEWRSKLARKYPAETNKDVSVRLGVMWRNLGAATKDAYYVSARQADAEHKRKYPGYYYSPQEARMRKLVHFDYRRVPKPDGKPLDGRPGHWRSVPAREKPSGGSDPAQDCGS